MHVEFLSVQRSFHLEFDSADTVQSSCVKKAIVQLRLSNQSMEASIPQSASSRAH